MLKALGTRYWLLLLLLVAGFGLRFRQDEDLGFYQGHNWEQVNNALAWADLTAYLFCHVPELPNLGQAQLDLEQVRTGWNEEITPDLQRFGEEAYTIAIRANWPVQIALNAVAVVFAGVEIRSLGLLAALVGWLCVPVYYLLGRSFADHRLGLLAALFTAVSTFAVILSRTVYDGQQFVPFFCGAILALYLQSLKTPDRAQFFLVAAGVVGGLGIGVQPVVLPFFGALVFFEFATSISAGLRRRTPRLLALGGGAVLTLLALELPYLAVGAVLGKNTEALYPGFRTFWGNFFYLVDQIHHEHGISLSLVSLLTTYFVYETVLSGALLVIGTATAIRCWRDRRFQLLGVLLLLPALYWLLISRNPPEPRHFLSAIFPVLILLSAVGFNAVCDWLPRTRRWGGWAQRLAPGVPALAGAVVVVSAIANLEPVYQASTGLKQAAGWLKERGVERVGVFADHGGTFEWLQYGIRSECIQPGDHAGGPRYLAALPRYATAQEKAFLAGCAQNGISPVFEVPHLFPVERTYEYRAAQSMFLCGLGQLPLVGPWVEQVRRAVLDANNLRRVYLFDVSDSRTGEIVRAASSSAVFAQRQEFNR